MQDPEILKIIENLKGRKSYEQKKANKLGFNSLYSYFEDKILRQKRILEEEKRKIEFVNQSNIQKKQNKKKSCNCC